MIRLILLHGHDAPQGLLPSAPQIRLFASILRKLERLAPRCPGQLLDHPDLLLHAGSRAGELEEERRCFRPHAVRHLRLVQAHHLVVVQYLDRGDRHPRADNLRHAIGCLLDGPEAAHGHRGGRGPRGDLQRSFRDESQRALAADEDLGQVVAGAALPRPLPGLDHRAIRKHHREAQHPLSHGAVPICVGPAAPRADHATYHGPGAGIGREEEVVLLQLGVQHLPPYSRLHHDVHILLVQLEDLVHVRKVNADPAARGSEVAFQARSPAVSRHGDAPRVADLHDLAHLFRALRENHHKRLLSLICDVR